MIDLEKLLRSAKPTVPDLPEDFNSAVMQRIEQLETPGESASAHGRFDRIQLAVGIAALLVATLLFNYNSYEIRMNGSLELLYFGRQYLLDFFSYLPLDLLIPALLFPAISVWMFRKSGMIKRGIASLAIISYLITGVGGSALAAIGFNEQIEATISENTDRDSWLKILEHSRAKEFIHHPHVRLGKVEKLMNGKAEVITPNGKRLTIEVPPKTDVKVGQYLRVAGNENESVFSAQKVHVCHPSRVDRYFSHMKHHKKMQHHQMMKPCCRKK